MGPLYHCVAANSNMSEPLEKTIRIDIMCKYSVMQLDRNSLKTDTFHDPVYKLHV